MDVVRVVLSVILAAGFVWIGLLNWSVAIKRLFSGGKTSSWIPLLGGAMGLGACLLVPLPALNQLWWFPLLLDWGTIPGLSFSLLVLAAKRSK